MSELIEFFLEVILESWQLFFRHWRVTLPLATLTLGLVVWLMTSS